MKQKIRIAVLLDGPSVPAWQYHLLQLLLESQSCSLGLLVFPPGAREPDAPGKPFLFRAFERYDAARTARATPDACTMKNAEELLGQVERLQLPHNRVSKRPVAADDAVGTAPEVDLVLALGRLPAGGGISLPAAPLGTWYYRHGWRQAECPAGWSVGFWEVVLGRPFIWSALMVRLPGRPDRVVYQSSSAVNYLSHGKSRNEHLWKILHFVPRSLERLQRSSGKVRRAADGIGGDPASALQIPGEPANGFDAESSAYRSLTNVRMLPGLAGYGAWRLGQKLKRLFYHKRWILMTGRDPGNNDFRDFLKLVPPEGRFWADPHLLRKGGRFYVFFEDASRALWHGHLAAIELQDNGEWSAPREIIKCPYHLSYPFLLEWQGELFLIPESGENRTVGAWRCRHFPYDWEFSHYLMQGIAAYDATLLQHEGTWWMFANVSAHDGASSWDELCLFYADSPLSENWQPHPMNPVVSDVRRARPAGRIFRREGRLLRPSQNSAYRYGYGLNINEILELTRETYRERLIDSVEPHWDRHILGVHSYSECDGLTVIDAVYRTPRFGGRPVRTPPAHSPAWRAPTGF